ncbi:Lsr2 family protein [Aeromicrobium sp. CF4.19]|uniref:histone-like nucleoid-structuring protein Lsr2 n=1 Tax=Aeromicrobium sp. CF4.19 TaxID=3373082 RepID=UPI003EE712AF
MARKTIEKFFSDLSGDEIDTPSPTVRFVFDGVGHEVDLTAAERETFEKAVAPYIAVGRRAGRAGSRATTSSGGPDAKAVRAWASENGLDVPARGRVPASIIEKYEAAH